MLNFLKTHWPSITIGFILAIVIGLNIHPGKLVLGNDNFSPELDPSLTISRSFLNPAWRDNRVLGIPSDSEQADIWRSIIFWFGELALPTSIVSQGYLFLTLLIGVISMGKVTQLLNKNSRSAQFYGSLLYLFSPITIWVYFYPVHLFVAAYAFTPLMLWTLLRVVSNPSFMNKILLLSASLIMGTTALTATMFITSSITILSISFFAALASKTMLKNWLISLFIFLLPQLFWILPFATYVKSNNQALQDSYINREITSTTIQSEQSNNTIWNTLRFSTTWMDTKEDDQSYTYSSRDWFKTNPTGIYLGYIPAIFALIGIISSLVKFKKNYDLLFVSVVGLSGWIFLIGNNPPFNQVYGFFDTNVPLFHQVFRWGSSKFWPILLIPMLILATKGVETLMELVKKTPILKTIVGLVFASFIIYAVHPIISSKLIRSDVFITVPSSYSLLKNYLPDKTSLIDTAPHANTRYFRRHDWGFWGSVFLNYLLPNPTTEKALIIGSYENESAFNVLDETYYSGNSRAYTNALLRFNIPYALSDKSVTNQGLGNSYSFTYDWSLHDRMVTANPYLNKVWSQDFLSLYKNILSVNKKTFAVSPNHNYETLNKSLALLNINQSYTTSPNSGDIFPLSVNPTEILAQNSVLFLSARPTTSGNYQIHISQNTLSDLPLIANIQNNKLIISPYYPSISLNSKPIYVLPQSITSLSTSIVTIGDQIIGNRPTITDSSQLAQTSVWRETTTQDLSSHLKSTPCNRDNNSPINQSCLSTDFNTDKPSVVNITTSFTSTSPTLVDICLHSYLKNTCLNSPQTFIATDRPQTTTISSNSVVEKNDNVVVFFIIKTMNNSIPQFQVSNLTIYQTTSPKPISIAAPSFEDINQNFIINSSDTLTLNLPIISLIPDFQIFQSICPDRGVTNKIDNYNDQISFITSNCFDGLYSSFSLPPNLGSTALLTYAKANNTQGIPLEYNLKQSGVEHKVTTDLFPTKNDESFLKFTLLPTANQNLTVELVNKGIGKTPSVNTLSDFTAIPIPTSWLALSLTPAEVQPVTSITTLTPYIPNHNTGTYLSSITTNSSYYTLPTATSPYWKAVILNQKPENILSLYIRVITGSEVKGKTLVNGYQPAWEISNNEGEYLGVIFLPNVLAYLGLILGMGVALILVFVGRATRIDATHTT